ncbi:MAG TPA: beta-ketoacyl-ACP synthase 3 [Solirubrobacteraceae bacterium]|nr:beta-ketoacyl-ACP synthase 3 [Solirubrobacteraceae bacterium]
MLDLTPAAIPRSEPVEPRTQPSRGAAIASLGTSLPAAVVSNGPIADRIGVTDEWIVKRTGISSRHVAAPGARLSDLAADAGRGALERAGVHARELDLVLVSTSSPDDLLPNAAPLLADALGATRAGAVDVGAACNGFLSALALGAGQIEARRADAVLIVGADLMSRIVDPDCRQTAALFGDGAGAALLTASQGPGPIGSLVLGADGAAGARRIVVDRTEAKVRMDGRETFRHAVARMAQATVEALEQAELGLDDVDLFVYHQANGRILRAVGEQLGLPPDRVIDCISALGNTSSATLPLALDHAQATDRLHAGDRVVLGAFGAGFTWGAAVIEWSANP